MEHVAGGRGRRAIPVERSLTGRLADTGQLTEHPGANGKGSGLFRTLDERLNDILATLAAHDAGTDGTDERFLRRYLEHTHGLVKTLHRKKENQRRTLHALNRALVIAKYDLGVAQGRARKVERKAKTAGDGR